MLTAVGTPQQHPLVPPHLKTELPSTVSFPWTPQVCVCIDSSYVRVLHHCVCCVQSSIQDVVSAFEAELELLQAFWSAMEGLDRSLWVLEPECPGAACTYRRVVLSKGRNVLRRYTHTHTPTLTTQHTLTPSEPNVSVVVTVVDPYKPLLPPSLKFLGPDDCNAPPNSCPAHAPAHPCPLQWLAV